MKKISILFIITVLLSNCKKGDADNTSNTPKITTDSVKNILYKSVEVVATISNIDAATVKIKGVCYATTTNPTVKNTRVDNGSGAGDFTTILSTLAPNSKYYIKAFAITNTDTLYGNELNCTTLPLGLAVITTNAATSVKQISAISGGVIAADGGSTITAKGICWAVSPNPTTADTKLSGGTGTGSFTLSAANLSPATTYYLRAYAINNLGTSYGSQISFTTMPLSVPGNGVTDVEGNTYPTVILGDKEWMAANLRVSKYKNGDVITNATTNTLWQTATTNSSGAWCYYNNTAGYNNTYGKLYNWYAVVDSRQLCPTGWHSPSSGEWTVLQAYLGGGVVAGGALKEAGVANWASPNTGATNISGFNALPGGYHENSSGLFLYQGTKGLYWSANQDGNNFGFRVHLRSSTESMEIGAGGYVTAIQKGDANSVRCVKD